MRFIRLPMRHRSFSISLSLSLSLSAVSAILALSSPSLYAGPVNPQSPILNPDELERAVRDRLQYVDAFRLIAEKAALTGVRVWLEPDTSALYFRYTRDAVLELKKSNPSRTFRYDWEEIASKKPTRLVVKGDYYLLKSFEGALRPEWEAQFPTTPLTLMGLNDPYGEHPAYQSALSEDWENLALTYSPLWSTGIELSSLSKKALRDFIADGTQPKEHPDFFTGLASGELKTPPDYLHGRIPEAIDPSTLLPIVRTVAAAIYLHRLLSLPTPPSRESLHWMAGLLPPPMTATQYLETKEYKGMSAGQLKKIVRRLKEDLANAAPRSEALWIYADEIFAFHALFMGLRNASCNQELTSPTLKLPVSLFLN